MLACPACSTLLRSDRDHRGMCWSCSGCGGELFTTASLKSIRADILADLQRTPRIPRAVPTRSCPLCAHGMARIHAGGPPPLPLDVCDRCRVVWFDQTEYAAVFPSRAKKSPSGAPPPKTWPRTFIPWMTYALMLACIVASCWVWWFTDRTLMHDWGYQPSDPWRHGGLTALTCFFLHLHPLHLIGNMLTLWSFGEEVEETLGRLWLLVMLTLATVAGCAMYGLIHADPTMPCIGASGGIAGVLTYFCLRFPHKKVVVFVGTSLYFYRIPMSAITWMAIWLLFQIAGAAIEHAYGSHIAYGAHLGGALVGATWFILRRWLVPPTTADLRKAWWVR